MDKENTPLPSQYESIPAFSEADYPSQSFLDWDPSNLNHQRDFFKNVASVEDALLRLVSKFPNLYIVRGSGLANPLGTKGDFLVGNLDSAVNYTKFDTTQTVRDLPILITAKLSDIISLMHSGHVILFHHEGDVLRFQSTGVINISLSEIHPEAYSSYFKISRPNRHKLDKSKYVSFRPTVFERALSVVRVFQGK